MKYLKATLALLLFSSGSASLHQIDEDDNPDAVVLLQAHMEMEKNKALSANSADEWGDDVEDERLSLEASCAPASRGLRISEFATSFADVVGPHEADAGDASTSLSSHHRKTLVEESSFNVTSVSEETSFAMLGTMLEVVACALLVDVLRRYVWKASGEKQGNEEPSKKTSTTSSNGSHVNRLLSAALAGDDQAFEANFLGCQEGLLEVDVWGCTALHYAAKGGSVHIISRIIDLGAKVHVIDAWDESPLHLAARAGCTQACARLLKAGANINALNAEDHTPLIVAGTANQEATCSLLLERGACAGGLVDDEIPPLVARLLFVKVLTDSAGVSSSAS